MSVDSSPALTPDVASPSPTGAAASRRGLRLGLLFLAVIAIAVVATGLFVRRSDAAKLKQRADDVALPTVSLIAPTRSPGAGTLELPGRLEAYSRAPIYARISGYLKSWKVDIGTPVKTGQLLAEIETPDLDQQLLQAKADLASAKANADLAGSTSKRWQSLLASDSVSRQEAEEKANDLATKRSAVNAAQANLDRYVAMKAFTRIVAPFDGVVTARSTDVGALINAGGGGPELFVVSDTRRLRVYVNVPQTYVGVVQRGTKAKLTVPEHPGRTYTATVESTAQAVNVASGSMLVQLAVDNAAGELLPGGFATVTLDLPHPVDVVGIPPGALIFDRAGLRVATVDRDDRVVLKPVTVARDLGRSIEISSGLSPDDRIIDSPPDGLANGDRVRIAQAAGPADRGPTAAPATPDAAKR